MRPTRTTATPGTEQCAALSTDRGGLTPRFAPAGTPKQDTGRWAVDSDSPRAPWRLGVWLVWGGAESAPRPTAHAPPAVLSARPAPGQGHGFRSKWGEAQGAVGGSKPLPCKQSGPRRRPTLFCPFGPASPVSAPAPPPRLPLLESAPPARSTPNTAPSQSLSRWPSANRLFPALAPSCAP